MTNLSAIRINKWHTSWEQTQTGALVDACWCKCGVFSGQNRRITEEQGWNNTTMSVNYRAAPLERNRYQGIQLAVPWNILSVIFLLAAKQLTKMYEFPLSLGMRSGETTLYLEARKPSLSNTLFKESAKTKTRGPKKRKSNADYLSSVNQVVQPVSLTLSS